MSLPDHSAAATLWIALAVLLMGMNKGGFPVGSIALPVLVLVWPDQAGAAREAVAFMLPLLCLMDGVAMLFYRRQVLWRRLAPLVPGALAGVAVGSALFVARESAPVALSDRALKLGIGLTGMAFAAAQWLMRGRADSAGPAPAPGAAAGLAPGFGAGLTSTLAHAAGPIVQMYLLPQRLPKLAFAATQAAFFWMLNLVKLAPFAAFGRLEPPQLRLAACMLPLIPAGVGLGYALVRLTGQRHYVALIRAVLAVTSGALVVKALWG